MWKLEKWYRCIYLQVRNKDTDAENRYVGTGERKGMVEQIGRLGWMYRH